MPPFGVGTRRARVTITPNLSLLLIMACFWAVFFLVSTQVVKPLGALLEERRHIVQNGAAALGTAQNQTREALAQCELQLTEAAAAAQRERAALRAAGEAERRARLEAARAEGHERLARLARELEEAGLQARAELRERSRQLAIELAGRLLGRRLAS